MKRLRYETKKKWIGFAFAVPWVIGFITFFLVPMIISIRFSISNVSPGVAGIDYEYIGFGNFKYLFVSDPDFTVTMMKTVGAVFKDLLLVIAFSIFMALILVQNFRGRLLARTMAFLPVIVASGAVLGIINGDSYSGQMMQGESSQINLSVLSEILENTGLASDTISSVVSAVSGIFEVVWKCGIQTLIFMAGLQAIPVSVKEAAKVEGATSWEFFWKITFPMLLPMLQLNVIYTIINSFTDSSNTIIERIFNLNSQLNYSYSSAIAWTYFAIVFVLIGIIYAVLLKLSKKYER